QTKPGLVVEVGTAIGYSGLFIAGALRELGRGRLVTFELDAARAAEAGGNFARAGVEGWVTQVVGDARAEIASVREPIDLLFLDGGFANYYPCLMNARDRLHAGTL